MTVCELALEPSILVLFCIPKFYCKYKSLFKEGDLKWEASVQRFQMLRLPMLSLQVRPSSQVIQICWFMVDFKEQKNFQYKK